MKILITGSLGFAGKHLSEYLRKEGHEVFGFDIKIKQEYDIRNYDSVRMALDTVQPDKIFHLAALAYVPESEKDIHRAIDTHIIGTINILNAVKNLGLRSRILLASTSEEYGYENQSSEVTEKSPTTPTTSYGATKNAMTTLALTYDLPIVITRAFNHIGPGKSPQYADSSFAKQIAHIEKYGGVLHHGDLTAIRNYTDVRDIVRAYTIAIDCEPGIYNVCSDNNVTIKELLDSLIQNSTTIIETKEKQSLKRSSSPIFYPPSYKKLKVAGWEPEIKFEDSIKDLLDDWRDR